MAGERESRSTGVYHGQVVGHGNKGHSDRLHQLHSALKSMRILDQANAQAVLIRVCMTREMTVMPWTWIHKPPTSSGDLEQFTYVVHGAQRPTAAHTSCLNLPTRMQARHNSMNANPLALHLGAKTTICVDRKKQEHSNADAWQRQLPQQTKPVSPPTGW